MGKRLFLMNVIIIVFLFPLYSAATVMTAVELDGFNKIVPSDGRTHDHDTIYNVSADSRPIGVLSWSHTFDISSSVVVDANDLAMGPDGSIGMAEDPYIGRSWYDRSGTMTFDLSGLDFPGFLRVAYVGIQFDSHWSVSEEGSGTLVLRDGATILATMNAGPTDSSNFGPWSFIIPIADFNASSKVFTVDMDWPTASYGSWHSHGVSIKCSMAPSIMEPPRRPMGEALFLIDCGPCPECFEGPCDPRINPAGDNFVIWHPEKELAKNFSRTRIGLRKQDGPLAAASIVKGKNDETLFVISVPYADAAKVDCGAVIFLDESGKSVAKIYGSRPKEHLGIDMAVYGDEVAVVSTLRILRFKHAKQTFERPLTSGLNAHLGLRVALTADVDGDKQADIMLGAPFADVANIKSAGLIQFVGSKSGQIIDTIYGRFQEQHLGESLQPLLLRNQAVAKEIEP